MATGRLQEYNIKEVMFYEMSPYSIQISNTVLVRIFVALAIYAPLTNTGNRYILYFNFHRKTEQSIKVCFIVIILAVQK